MPRLLALIVLLMSVSCHSSSTEPIIEEPGPPPLPPASGTAIGILLDESTKLALRSDQIDRLHEIDQQLSTRNVSLDEQLREMDRPAEAPAGEQGGMGGRHRGGGMRGGGMRGAGGGGNASSSHHHRPQQGAGGGASGGARQKLQDEEAANTRDALERAFAALDPDQRTKARAILDEHGVTGAPDAPPTASEGEGSAETDDGSDN